MSRRDRVVWCDHGWQPLHFGFCPSERAWTRQMRKDGFTAPYPETDAGSTLIRDGSFKADCVLVTVADYPKRSGAEVIGLLVHEAMHVLQHVKRAMRDEAPSAEFEAYAMQAISQQLIQAYAEMRGTLRVKP